MPRGTTAGSGRYDASGRAREGDVAVPRIWAEPLGIEVYPALYRALTGEPETLGDFFPLPPGDPAAWAERARAVDRLWAGEDGASRRRGLVAALSAIQQKVGHTAAQAANLEALGADGALVVVTGQQAGLLGGPLYTVYKALGAVVRARQAARALGRPVVPVFWVASEDHDWSEVSQVGGVGPRGAAVQLRLAGHGEGRSAGHQPVPPEARHLVGELESLFPPSAEGAAVLEGLRAGLRGLGRGSLADWFTVQLQALLGHTGLLFYDPMLPALRRLAAPALAGAVERAPAAHRALAAQAGALRQRGFAPGLEVPNDHTLLFTYLEGRRVSLHRDGERIRSADGRVDCSSAEVARRVEEGPENFSPNVVPRPVVQDCTLPVLSQLGGPGEVAYLAQLPPVFALWDRPVPIVSPRPGGTVVGPEDRRALAAAEMRPADFYQDLEGAVEQAARAVAPVDLEGIFAAEQLQLQERYAHLETVLAGVGPAMPELVRRNAAHVRHQLLYLETKAHQHRRRAARAVVGELRATAGRLFPGGSLQERHQSVYPYLLQAGPTWLEALQEALAAAPGPFGTHWLFQQPDA